MKKTINVLIVLLILCLVMVLALNVLFVVAIIPAQNGPQGEQGLQGERGPQGEQGKQGDNGDSAYDIWLEQGNTGSKEDFLNWLKGEAGKQGPQGEAGKDGVDGKDGADGEDGKDGSTWYYGTVAPTDDTGNDGDFYYQNVNGLKKGYVIYYKTGGEWTKVFEVTELASAEDIGKMEKIAVADVDELATVAELVNSGLTFEGVEVTLEDNLNLSNIDWTPIGSKEHGKYFSGTFDGKYHTVEGLALQENNLSNDDDFLALFGAVKDATIKNVTVKGTISGNNVGGIAGRVVGNTIFENCTNEVAVTGTIKAGGIANSVTSAAGETVQFINCVNNANITYDKGTQTKSAGGTGGIIGYVGSNATITIINCENSGVIYTGSNFYTGVAVGYASSGSKGYVSGFVNSGSVSGFTAGSTSMVQNDVILCGFVGSYNNTPGHAQYNNWKLIEVEEGKSVAVVGQDDIQDALESEDVAYVIVAEDVVVVTLKVGEGKTVDLNGNELYKDTYTGGNHIYFSGTTGTVKNGTLTYRGTNASTFKLTRIENGANVTFENIKFESNRLVGAAVDIWNEATVTFKNCSFINAAITVGGSGKHELDFVNCAFNATITDNGRKFIDVSKATTGHLNMTDCHFDCTLEGDSVNVANLISGKSTVTDFKISLENVTYTANGSKADKLKAYDGNAANLTGSLTAK